MSNELTVTHGPRLQSLDDFVRLGDLLAKSGYFADARSGAQAVVKILAGAELGFGPLASLTGVHIVEGKPCPGSHLLAAAIRRSGTYDYKIVEHTDEACAIEFVARRDGAWVTLGIERLTLEEAKAKGWTISNAGKVKSPWIKTPRNMLFARCMSNGFKFHCPDLVGGVVTYDADELDSAEAVQAEPGQLPPPSSNGTPAAAPEILIARDQHEELVRLVRQLPTTIYTQLEQRYQVATLDKLPAVHFDDACRFLRDNGADAPPSQPKDAPLYEAIKNTPSAAPPADLPTVTREQIAPVLAALKNRTVEECALALRMIGLSRWGQLPVAWLPVALDLVRSPDLDHWSWRTDMLGVPFAELSEETRNRIIVGIRLTHPEYASA